MNSLPGKPVHIVICSSPTFLPVVRAAVEKICELIGFDTACVGNIILSTDEALTNIIKHAYGGASDKPIEIDLIPLDEHARGLCIRLRDHGQTVDLSRIKGRDLSDIRPGGLGVHIMTKCMDQLEYRPAEGGGTVLTMVKRMPAAKKETEP